MVLRTFNFWGFVARLGISHTTDLDEKQSLVMERLQVMENNKLFITSNKPSNNKSEITKV